MWRDVSLAPDRYRLPDLEVLLTVTRRSRTRTGTKQDKSTLLVVWVGIMVSVAAGVYVAGYWPATALPYGHLFALASVFLFVVGVVLRWWAIITLGRFFTWTWWSSADRFGACVIRLTPAFCWRSSVLL